MATSGRDSPSVRSVAVGRILPGLAIIALDAQARCFAASAGNDEVRAGIFATNEALYASKSARSRCRSATTSPQRAIGAKELHAHTRTHARTHARTHVLQVGAVSRGRLRVGAKSLRDLGTYATGRPLPFIVRPHGDPTY